MSTMDTAVPINALFSKPELAIGNPQGFEQVRTSISDQFAAARVSGFLGSLEGRKLRIRDFETVLSNGLLGPKMLETYNQLGNGDQGQIREYYLASLERVAPELRQKFFKLYSYY